LRVRARRFALRSLFAELALSGVDVLQDCPPAVDREGARGGGCFGYGLHQVSARRSAAGSADPLAVSAGLSAGQGVLQSTGKGTRVRDLRNEALRGRPHIDHHRSVAAGSRSCVAMSMSITSPIRVRNPTPGGSDLSFLLKLVTIDALDVATSQSVRRRSCRAAVRPACHSAAGTNGEPAARIDEFCGST
jgi:hypothetical protein